MITTKRKQSNTQINSPLLERDTSFMLMRTNPLLTGNLKITVDSSSSIWLNTMDANAELSNSKYKKYKTSGGASFAVDLKTLVGDVPASVLFDKFEKDQLYTSTKRNLSEQMDMFYCAGAEQLVSKFYDEDYSFFAPMWLGKILPDYFVIFRIDGAGVQRDDLSSMIKNSSIIKTFSLKDGTDIGRYLRGITSHPEFRDSPIDVNFDPESLTEWNGVSYANGTWTSKGERLYDYYTHDRPLLEFEEFITKGFQRNGIICANMVNLEFLFDDTSVEDYTINRYWGAYVSENELASFFVSTSGLKKDLTSLNVRDIELVSDLHDTPLPVSNPGGVDVYASNIESGPDALLGTIDADSIEEPNLIYYIRDKKDSFYSVNSAKQWATDIHNSALYEPYWKLAIANKEIDYSNFTGRASLSIQQPGEIIQTKTHSHLEVEVTEIPQPGTILEVEWHGQSYGFKFRAIANNIPFQRNLSPVSAHSYNSGTGEAAWIIVPGNFENTEYPIDAITYLDGSTPSGFMEVTGFENTGGNTKIYLKAEVSLSVISSVSLYAYRYHWKTPQYDSVGEKWYTYYNCLGTDKSIIAENIKDSFYEFEGKNFRTASVGETIVIQAIEPGTWGDMIKVRTWIPGFLGVPTQIGSIVDVVVPNPSNPSTNSTVNAFEYHLEGGSDRIGSAIVVKKDTTFQMRNYFYDYASTKEGFSRIKSITSYIEEPVYSDEKITSYTRYGDYETVILQDDLWLLNSNGEFNMYKKYRTSLGAFSIFPVRDFDIDYHSEKYSTSPNIELEHLFRNYREGEALQAGMNYYVEGTIELIKKEIGSFSLGFVGGSPWSQYNELIPKAGHIRISTDVVSSLRVGDPIKWDDTSSTIETTITDIYLDGSETIVEHGWKEPYTSVSNLRLQIYTNISMVNDSNFLVPQNGTHVYLDLAPSTPAKVFIDFIDFDEDLTDFKGFGGLTDFLSMDDERILKELFNTAGKTKKEARDDKMKALTWKKIRSEYFRMRENFNKEFAVKSRVVPHILKWGMRDGKDVRENPYRLNVSPAFGTTNFSPADIKEPLPEGYTHEWMYIDGVPSSLSPESIDMAYAYFFGNFDELHQNAKVGDALKYLITGYPIEQWADSADSEYESKYTSAPIKKSEKFSKFFSTKNDLIQTFFRGAKIQIEDLVTNTTTPLFGSKRFQDYTFSAMIARKPFIMEVAKPYMEYRVIDYKESKHIQLVIELSLTDYRAITDYLFLYSNRSKRKLDIVTFDSYSLKYDDHRLSSALSMGTPSSQVLFGKNNIRIVPYKKYDANGKRFVAYEPNLFEEILLHENGKFTTDRTGLIYPLPSSQEQFSSIGIRFPDSYTGAAFDFELTNLEGVKDSTTLLFPKTKIFKSPKNANIWTPKNATFNIDEYYRESYSVYYGETKGINRNLLKRISFSEIASLINKESSQVQYVSVDINGVESKGNFRLKVLPPHTILQKDTVFPSSDEQKPEALHTVSTIGFVSNRHSDSRVLYRYGGKYQPIFRDVINFAVTETQGSTHTYSRNTSIMEKGFGSLPNVFINKVADREILRIQQSTALPSLYPLIGEVSIDKKELNVFSSNWSTSYYRKYVDTTTYNEVDGTEEMQEFKNFMGSKMMRVPKEILLYGFGDFTSNVNDVTKDTIISSSFSAKFLFVNRITNFLMDSGIRQTFLDYESSNPIWKTLGAVKMAEDYIRKNVLNLYTMGEIKMYQRPLKAGESIDYTLAGDEEWLFNSGFTLDKSPTVRAIDEYTYTVDKTMDTGNLKQVTCVIKFKRI